jgi:hypothetical protein
MATGFSDLVLRLQAQQAALDEHQSRMVHLRKLASDLAAKVLQGP